MQEKSEIDSLLKKLQSILTNWMIQNLNTLPFWLSQKTEQQTNMPTQPVVAFLQNMKGQLKIKENNDLHHHLNSILKNLELISSGYISQNIVDTLEQQREEFFKKLDLIKEKSLEEITLYSMKQDSFAEQFEDLEHAKWIQHRIVALQQLIVQPDQILLSEEAKPLFYNVWLEKKNYADLLFLLKIISPDKLIDCLKQKALVYQEVVENLQGLAKQFNSHWQDQTATIVRNYRILRIYQHWEAALNNVFTKFNTDDPADDWTSLTTFLRLFSYEKKQFFHEAVKTENTILIFGQLTMLLNSRQELNNAEKMLNYLKLEKQTIATKLDEDKNQLLNKYPSWKKMIAFLGLAFTEQPSYQVGMLGFELGNDSIASLEKLDPEKAKAINDQINEWGNKVVPSWVQDYLDPERDLKIIQHLTGFFCLVVNQGFSSWLGYSYYFVSSVNRVLFSQFDALVSLGSTFGFDEINLLEHEKSMHWLSGLGIHLLFLQNSTHLLPTFFSYLAATTVSYSSNLVISDLIKKNIEDKEIFNPKALLLGKFAIEACIYSKVYSTSFEKVAEVMQSELTKNLKTMGFYAHPSKEDLKRRYRELAVEYHPDKCKTRNLDSSSCETNAKNMRDLNQAYSYLKSRNP